MPQIACKICLHICFIFFFNCISGAEYWGKANKAWIICSKGKYQSPINIDPKSLVHDPNLKQLNVSQNKVT